MVLCSHSSDEAFQGAEVTSDMAPKSVVNLSQNTNNLQKLTQKKRESLILGQ